MTESFNETKGGGHRLNEAEAKTGINETCISYLALNTSDSSELPQHPWNQR